MSTKTRETITFNHFYQHDYGFNWGVFVAYESSLTQYCDTGYNNVLHGNGEAFTSPFSDGYSFFVSENLGESFALKSMIAASAWCSEQTFTFNSYTYSHGALHLKASVPIELSQTGQTIDFANYGKDFKNIEAVSILSDGLGTGGSTCTYGSTTYGYQMAFDNMKVVWNGPIPGGHAEHDFLPSRYLQHQHAEHAIAASAPLHHGPVSGEHQSGIHAIGPPGRAHGFYHSELLSLHDAHSGLTSQFALPGVEHFGT